MCVLIYHRQRIALAVTHAVTSLVMVSFLSTAKAQSVSELPSADVGQNHVYNANNFAREILELDRSILEDINSNDTRRIQSAIDRLSVLRTQEGMSGNDGEIVIGYLNVLAQSKLGAREICGSLQGQERIDCEAHRVTAYIEGRSLIHRLRSTNAEIDRELASRIYQLVDVLHGQLLHVVLVSYSATEADSHEESENATREVRSAVEDESSTVEVDGGLPPGYSRLPRFTENLVLIPAQHQLSFHVEGFYAEPRDIRGDPGERQDVPIAFRTRDATIDVLTNHPDPEIRVDGEVRVGTRSRVARRRARSGRRSGRASSHSGDNEETTYRVRIPNVDPGDHEVTIVAEGYAPRESSVTTSAGHREDVNGNLELEYAIERDPIFWAISGAVATGLALVIGIVVGLSVAENNHCYGGTEGICIGAL